MFRTAKTTLRGAGWFSQFGFITTTLPSSTAVVESYGDCSGMVENWLVSTSHCGSPRATSSGFTSPKPETPASATMFVPPAALISSSMKVSLPAVNPKET